LEAASPKGHTGSLLGKVQRRATRFIDASCGMAYDERLRIVGLATLETRRLRADMVKVDKMLRSFEETDEVNNSEEGGKNKRT